MRITVIGLHHLGCVFASGLAKLGHTVTGLEMRDPLNLSNLRNNIACLDEPGLSSQIAAGRNSGKLSWGYATEHTVSCATDVLWVCHDVAVNINGDPNASFCLSDLRYCLRFLLVGKLVILTSQLPVGTCAKLQAEFPNHRFAVIPENLRIGKAIECFERPVRTIIGIRPNDTQTREEIGALLTMLPGDVITMSSSSAEMAKHALNGFLALSVAYTNEIARICDINGACASDVAKAVMSDERVGKKAYLRPGPPFTGWTLVRDLATLCALEESAALKIIPQIKPSNDAHAERMGVTVAYKNPQ